jgi:tetratricopeptide (TPR) repeat protein
MPDTQVQPDSLQSEEPWQLPRQPVPGSMSDQSSEKVVPAQVDAATPDSVWSLSIDELEKRIAADTLDSDARFALARRYQAHGQFDRAIDLYQKAIQLDPANANAQNDIGVALQQRGRRAEAEVAYRRAAALDPFSSTAHVNLGLLLRSLNRASEASQAFFQARKNARGDAESKRAEAASAGGKLDPQLSRFQNS